MIDSFSDWDWRIRIMYWISSSRMNDSNRLHFTSTHSHDDCRRWNFLPRINLFYLFLEWHSNWTELSQNTQQQIDDIDDDDDVGTVDFLLLLLLFYLFDNQYKRIKAKSNRQFQTWFTRCLFYFIYPDFFCSEWSSYYFNTFFLSHLVDCFWVFSYDVKLPRNRWIFDIWYRQSGNTDEY